MTWVKMTGLVVAGAVAAVLVAAYVFLGAFLPWREAAEAAQLADVLELREGYTVADVGAGSGRFTEQMARRVGPSGRVYSTEIDERNLESIRRRMEGAGLRNVTVLAGAERSTNLPDACCDAILLRNVYHHIGDPDAFARSLRRALKPDGRLAIIDFEPGALPFHGGKPDGAADRRTGHGVDRGQVREEMSGAGLALLREVPDWNGRLWLMVFGGGRSQSLVPGPLSLVGPLVPGRSPVPGWSPVPDRLRVPGQSRILVSFLTQLDPLD